MSLKVHVAVTVSESEYMSSPNSGKEVLTMQHSLSVYTLRDVMAFLQKLLTACGEKES